MNEFWKQLFSGYTGMALLYMVQALLGLATYTGIIYLWNHSPKWPL